MKKIFSKISLLLIGSISLFSLAGCKDDDLDQHENSKGNSIWAMLNFGDGDKAYDSEDVWKEVNPFYDNQADTLDLNNLPGAVKGRLSLAVLRIMNVSLLVNWKSISDSEQHSSDLSGFRELDQLMSHAWQNLKDNTENAVQNKIDEFKKNDKKKWEKNWQDFLDDNYDGSVDKYKAELLASGEGDNASMEISEIILNQKQSGFLNVTTDTIKSYQQEYLASKKTWGEWGAKHPYKARLILLSSVKYYEDGQFNQLWQHDEQKKLTKEEVVQHAPGNSIIRGVPKRLWDSSKNSYGDRTLSESNHSKGLISELQKLLLSNWFQWKKPLAYSKVTFAYDSNPKTRPIYKDLFNGLSEPNRLFNQTTLQKISSFLKNISSGTWGALSEKTIVETTFSDKLLVLGAKDEPYLTSAVYSNMTQLTQRSPAMAIDSEVDLSKITGQVNRTAQDKMAAVYSFGPAKRQVRDRLLVFYDDTGLNFVHIDGLWSVLQQGQQSGFKYVEKISSYQKQRMYHDTFENYVFPAIKNNQQPIASADQIIGNGLWSFNKPIANFYLQYLVNQSFINDSNKDTGKVLTKFDVMKDLTQYVAIDKDSKYDNGLWWTWTYYFFDYYFKNVIKTALPEWFNQAVQLPQNKNGSKNYWFYNTVLYHNASLKQSLLQDAVKNIADQNKTIEENILKKNEGSYPVGKFFSNEKLLTKLKKILFTNTTTGSFLWWSGVDQAK